MAKFIWAFIIWGQIYPALAYADPLVEAGEEIQSELHFKKSGTLPNGSNELSWGGVKPLIISSWKDLIDRLSTTKPHAEFMRSHNLVIKFEPLDGKFGTYSRDSRAAVFNDSYFKEQWQELRRKGLNAETAGRELAVKSFPGFAHVLRDQMMDEDLQNHGFVYTGGWVEDEVIHHKEQARVILELRKLFPNFKTHIQVDDLMDNVVEISAKGNGAIAAMIRDSYNGMPSLFYNKDAYFMKGQNAFDLHVRNEGYEVDSLKDHYKDCQETSSGGGCKRRMDSPELHSAIFAQKKAKNKYVYGPGVPCYYKWTSVSHNDRFGIPVINPMERHGRWSYSPCGKNWQTRLPNQIQYIQKRIDFLNDKTGLERVKQYYRQMLAQWGINPEELKQ